MYNIFSFVFMGFLIFTLFSIGTFAQASFEGIGDLPGGSFFSDARSVSADGLVVVGRGVSANGEEAFRWENGVMSPLGDLPGGSFSSVARGVSADGLVVVGYSSSANGDEAFRWENNVMTPLGGLLDGGFLSDAYGVSADGSVVVGTATTVGPRETFRWENNVMTPLGDLLGGGFHSIASGVSADGSVIVGLGTSANGGEAFRWENNVMTPLGDLPGGGFNSDAYGVSSDGSIVVGASSSANGDEAFIWTTSGGMRSLKDILVNDFGLDLIGWTLALASAISDDGTVIVGYGTNPDGNTEGWRAVIPRPAITVTSPLAGELWIAGEQDTIRWEVAGLDSIDILLSTDYDNGTGTFENLIEDYPADSGFYAWDIPDTILSRKCVISIEDAQNQSNSANSELFKIKGYQLTKVDENGDYVAYNIITDRWGFRNTKNDMWPSTWWSRFDYQGIDPFTGDQYSQWQGNFTFKVTLPQEFFDWIAFVNAFTENACYISTILGLYSPTALSRWDAKKNGLWGGSCFGIAASNALAFSHKSEFTSKFPSFPNFINPITVTSDTNVIPVISQLFTHQFGNPTFQLTAGGWNTITVNQTLNEAKAMFLQDDVPIRTLSIWNNNGSGGHAILPYKLEQDKVQKQLYYLYVYDNSHPDSTGAFVLIDTTGFVNNGTWSTQYAWSNWGGPQRLMLELEASNYLNDPILPKNSDDFVSPFILSGDELEVYNNIDANTRIYDSQGKLTGFVNGTVYNEITKSVPLIYLNGSETPPYGYYLPTDNYSVQISDVISDTVETFFFTGNKTFLYKRTETITSETDRLFFDGGVSAVNPDQDDKSISLVNIINESTQEKLYALRSLSLSQNDSVKIENVNDDQLKLISYGTSKNYDIELNFVSESGFGRFGHTAISLDENTTHIFLPDWSDVSNTELTIHVDNGNDGTIDDTLFVSNTVDVEDQGNLGIPGDYYLSQNYPNPFNPVTKIRYSLPQLSEVTLTVYNILGQEVITLVNEQQPAGNYEVSFDAANLTSGIYLYKIQAGDPSAGSGQGFTEVKKMILLR